MFERIYISMVPLNNAPEFSLSQEVISCLLKFKKIMKVLKVSLDCFKHTLGTLVSVDVYY